MTEKRMKGTEWIYTTPKMKKSLAQKQLFRIKQKKQNQAAAQQGAAMLLGKKP